MASKNQYEIGVAMDTGPFEKSVSNGLVDPLEEAEDAFDSLEKAAKNADLDKELTKAQKAPDKLDDELDDAREALKKLGHSARDAGDDTKGAFKGASENVEEFKNEAAQNFSEVTSSFDGSMDSILDLAQGTLGGLASGIEGPLGVALGVAAAGIGLVVSGLIEGEERAEELRQRAREFAVEAVLAGKSSDAWMSSAEQVVARIQELEQLKSTDWRWFWQEDPTQLQEWTDGLRKMGRGTEDLSKILSGSADDMKDQRAEIVKGTEAIALEIAEISKKGFAISDADRARAAALQNEADGYQDVIKLLDQEITMRDEATSSHDRQVQAGIDAVIARREAEEEAAAAIQSAQESVAASVDSAYDTMRNAATEYATAEDGALDINRWLEYTQEHQAAVDQYRANVQAIKLSPEQWQNLLEMPEGQRMQWVAQFAALPEEARAPFSAALNDVGSSGGSDAAVAFDDSFNPDADVTVEVDTSEATDDLDTLANTEPGAEIEVKTTGKAAAESDLDDLAKKRTATIEAKVSTSTATSTMSAWRRAQEAQPITITVNTRSGRTQFV